MVILACAAKILAQSLVRGVSADQNRILLVLVGSVPPYLLHLWGQGAPWQIGLLVYDVLFRAADETLAELAACSSAVPSTA